MQRVGGKGDRDRGDGAALDDEEQRPAVQEAGERMQSVAQVDVLAARLGKERAELGVGERAGQRDRAAGDPRPQHEQRRVETLRDDVGSDEDAGADDPPDHHHRGVEGTERALEVRRTPRPP